jgi:hypothetical protein
MGGSGVAGPLMKSGRSTSKSSGSGAPMFLLAVPCMTFPTREHGCPPGRRAGVVSSHLPAKRFWLRFRPGPYRVRKCFQCDPRVSTIYGHGRGSPTPSVRIWRGCQAHRAGARHDCRARQPAVGLLRSLPPVAGRRGRSRAGTADSRGDSP